MKTFIAVYRGETISSATLIAVTADPKTVADVTKQLLGDDKSSGDPIVEKHLEGRREALKLIKDLADEENG